MRDRILARIGQGEAALDVIRETLGKRAVRGPQARAAEAEDAAQAEAAMTLGEPQGRPEELPDSVPPSSGPPGAPDAAQLDQHAVDGVVDTLEAAVRELRQGELSLLHAQRLEERLSEIQRTILARAAIEEPTTPTNEAPGALPAATPSAPLEFAPDSSTLDRPVPAHPVPDGAATADRPRPQLARIGIPRQALVDEAHPSVPRTEDGARSPPAG